MSQASYVSIDRGDCVVCGCKFETGTLMIEREVPAEGCVLGWELCPSDAQMHKFGFAAIVECELDMTAAKAGDVIQPHAVKRTGNLMHVTRETFTSLFNTQARPTLPCAYVPAGTVQQLRALLQPALN
ncbi:hypothetical protein ACFPN2_21585 [Steroidobacter flavus]|uniref:ATPase n=1 Tax=Steroidobacter flavus TaxID=1842136 RepID=A0ABV8SYH6_9GAMM